MQSDDTEIGGSGPADGEPGPAVLAEPSPPIETSPGPGNPKTLPPGIEGVQTTWEYRCKICQLAIKFPTMYKMLHDLVLKDGMSYNGAMAEMNAYIKQHKLEIATFNMVNILGHFNKHVDIKARTAMIVAKAVQGAPLVPSAVRPLQSYVDGLAGQRARSEVDDYENLDDIRLRVTAVMHKLMQELEDTDPATNTLRLSKHGIQLFIGLVTETRACINDLNKMRQSEKLMNTVVQQLLEKMTFAIIPQLLEEYKSLNEELTHSGLDQHTIDMVDLRLRTKTAEIIATTARAAVMEIQRQFKLR